MTKVMWSVLTITLFVSLVIFNFSHKSVSQVDLDNMFGGGTCPATFNCSTDQPPNPSNGNTYCKGDDYTDCVDSPNNPDGTCNTSYSNENPKYCGEEYRYDSESGLWFVEPDSHCTTVPNTVSGSGCSG